MAPNSSQQLDDIDDSHIYSDLIKSKCFSNPTLIQSTSTFISTCQSIINFIQRVYSQIHYVISQPSCIRTYLMRFLYYCGFLALTLILLFNFIQYSWFLSTPARIKADLAFAMNQQQTIGTITPHKIPNIGYDLINPLDNHDFPLINVQLEPAKPTYPAGFHHRNERVYDPNLITISELDFKHQYLLPTDPIEVEKPLHILRFWNPTPIPLPYNPLGYRYFMSRRAVRPKHLDEEKSETHWNNIGSTQLTCFSDWFPYDLIKEQDDEVLIPLLKKEKKIDDHVLPEINRQYGPAIPHVPQETEIESPHRVVINTTRIDKEKLAKYYGYEKYSDMPFHPRIPTKTTNTTWSHRCITPWKDDDYGVLKQRHHRLKILGQEDMRLAFDRCGRMLMHYVSWNDYGPFKPDWGMRVIDARRFDSSEMLFRPLSDLCPIRHTYQEPLHLIGGGVEGHQPSSTKNWMMMNYGQSPADMTEMLKLRLEFTKAASLYDYRTNSLLLTHHNYQDILTKFAPNNPPLIPPWRSQERLPRPQTKPPTTTIDYLRTPSTYVTRLAPFSQISGPVEKFEKPIGTMTFADETVLDDSFPTVTKKTYALQECLHSYNDFRYKAEHSMPYLVHYIHATANLLLVHIRPEDWENDPFLSSTPPEKRIPWVYFGVGNDRSHKNLGESRMYRPFMIMLDATTSELIAVRPFITVLPHKCSPPERDDVCKHGQGTNCQERCQFIYLHYLTSTQTPLTYSIIANSTTTPPPPPPKSIYPNFNDKIYDRQYQHDTSSNTNFTSESNEFFQSILNDRTQRVDINNFIPTNNIPPTANINFTNPQPKSSTASTASTSSTSSFSSNTTTQGLHFTLPTYYTLDSQIFAVINSDDRQAYLQEFDLMAFWRQRHPCNIELDAKTYPLSIPQKNVRHVMAKKHHYRYPRLKWSPPKQTMEVFDWAKIDGDNAIKNVPLGTPQVFDIPHLPAELNWPRYVNMEEYPERARYVYEKYVLPPLTYTLIFLATLFCFDCICSRSSYKKHPTTSTTQHRPISSSSSDDDENVPFANVMDFDTDAGSESDNDSFLSIHTR